MNQVPEVFGFNNGPEVRAPVRFYRGVNGGVDRVGLLYRDPGAVFCGTQTHYKDRYIVCKKGRCCSVLGRPRWRVGVILARYETNNSGNLIGVTAQPWIFGERMYEAFRPHIENRDLNDSDVQLTCSIEEYQYIKVTIAGAAKWKRFSGREGLLKEFDRLYAELPARLGVTLSDEEMEAVLASATPILSGTLINTPTQVTYNPELEYRHRVSTMSTRGQRPTRVRTPNPVPEKKKELEEALVRPRRVRWDGP